MKKTWIEPEIEKIDLSSTAYDAFEGVEVDGPYLNPDDCEYYDAYHRS